MSKRVVIGFGHKMRRGKDVAGDIAVMYLDYLGMPVRRDSFAHSLKEGLGRGIFGLSDEQLYGELKGVEDEFWGVTPREILQRGGTECMRRGYDENIWTDTVRRRAWQDPISHIVLTDVRFPNEAATVKELGGSVIRIDRDVPPGDFDDHPSETALDDYSGWDHIVKNSGTIADLTYKIQDLLNGVLHHCGIIPRPDWPDRRH